MILGLDISTSIVGICILAEGDVVLSEHIDISKLETMFEKAELVGSELWQIHNNYRIENIFVENGFVTCSHRSTKLARKSTMYTYFPPYGDRSEGN